MGDYFWNQQAFFQGFWQRKPWHGKNQLPVQDVDIDPKDLDYLCRQESVTSRLIVQDGDGFKLEKASWDTQDTRNRTLFVQEMDRWFPEVLNLLQAFSRYPRWRLDDIMGSYSTKGSSSSPHVDFYDVFIVQVAGSKTWKVEKTKRTFEDCQSSALSQHDDLRIINNIKDCDAFLLEPGDVLYVPTRYVHEAIAEEDSYSYSIGLRSPRIKDMVAQWAPEKATSIDEDLRMEEEHIYTDPCSIPDNLFSHITNWPTSVDVPTGPTPEWFGKLVTAAQDDIPTQAYFTDILLEDQQTLLAELADPDLMWVFDPACKMAWQKTDQDNLYSLFIQGEHMHMPRQACFFIEQLLTSSQFSSLQLQEIFEQEPWTKMLWTYLCVNEWMAPDTP